MSSQNVDTSWQFTNFVLPHPARPTHFPKALIGWGKNCEQKSSLTPAYTEVAANWLGKLNISAPGSRSWNWVKTSNNVGGNWLWTLATFIPVCLINYFLIYFSWSQTRSLFVPKIKWTLCMPAPPPVLTQIFTGCHLWICSLGAHILKCYLFHVTWCSSIDGNKIFSIGRFCYQQGYTI